MNKKNNRKGFTIVELVIVIAVIAILATVMVPTFGNVIDKAKNSALVQELKNEYTEFMIKMADDDTVTGYDFSDDEVIIKIEDDYYTFSDGELDMDTNDDSKPAKHTIAANEWYWNGSTMVQYTTGG